MLVTKYVLIFLWDTNYKEIVVKFHNSVKVSRVVQIGIRIENIKFSFVYYDPKTNIDCITICVMVGGDLLLLV
jgi:hypothetical protein